MDPPPQMDPRLLGILGPVIAGLTPRPPPSQPTGVRRRQMRLGYWAALSPSSLNFAMGITAKSKSENTTASSTCSNVLGAKKKPPHQGVKCSFLQAPSRILLPCPDCPPPNLRHPWGKYDVNRTLLQLDTPVEGREGPSRATNHAEKRGASDWAHPGVGRGRGGTKARVRQVGCLECCTGGGAEGATAAKAREGERSRAGRQLRAAVAVGERPPAMHTAAFHLGPPVSGKSNRNVLLL